MGLDIIKAIGQSCYNATGMYSYLLPKGEGLVNQADKVDKVDTPCMHSRTLCVQTLPLYALLELDSTTFSLYFNQPALPLQLLDK